MAALGKVCALDKYGDVFVVTNATEVIEDAHGKTHTIKVSTTVEIIR